MPLIITPDVIDPTVKTPLALIEEFAITASGTALELATVPVNSTTPVELFLPTICVPVTIVPVFPKTTNVGDV